MYPILFTMPDWLPVIGGLPIYSFGVLVGLGVVLGWAVTRRLATADELRPGRLEVVLLVALACGLLGARAGFLVTHRDQWVGPSSLLQLGAAGQILVAGLLAAVLGAYVASRLARVSFWSLADHAAPGLALGLGLGRIGCFLFGCDFGRATSSAIGVRFPMWSGELAVQTGQHGSPAFLEHFGARAGSISEHVLRQVGQLRAMSQSDVAPVADAMRSALVAFEAKLQTLGTFVMEGASDPVVPTQLLAAANGLVAFAGLLWLHRRRAFAGQVLLALGIYYGLTRVLLDLTRGDPDRVMVGPLSLSQVLSVAIAIVAGLVWLRRRRDRPEPDRLKRGK